MPLPSWTETQIRKQLDYKGADEYEWTTNVITFAFPLSAVAMYGFGELEGFGTVDADTQAMLRIAVQLWDDLITPRFSEVTASLGLLDGWDDADIEIGFTNTEIGYAHSYFPDAGTVWLNSDYDAATGINNLVGAPVGSYGFSTYVHELGHALGLDHMGDYDKGGPFAYQDSTVYTIMSYFGPGVPGSAQVAQADWENDDGFWEVQTPQLSDIMTIQSMYGASTTTRTGDTTYGFNSNVTGLVQAVFDFSVNANPVLTIFDSGGTDTLDLSGWASGSQISLLSGTFSSANGMTNNIAIAYSATLENAVGGGGADEIIGNPSANALVGGGGNDNLKGGGGDDTLTGGAGNDYMNGEAGTDTAVFGATLAGFTVTRNPSTGALNFTSSGTGTDTVLGVEVFQFSDAIRSAAQLLPPESLSGTNGADVLTGGAFMDILSGLAGNDTLRGNAADDQLDGGDGLDTAVFGGARVDYAVTVSSSVTVSALAGSDGTDSLTGVERLQFSDINLALDLDGNAGKVARILAAVFGTDGVGNEVYAGIGLDMIDGGVGYAELMELALRVRLGWSASSADVVQLLYTNVIGSPPDAPTRDGFAAALDSGAFTWGTLGVLAADTTYNAATNGLAQLSVTGLEYL